MSPSDWVSWQFQDALLAIKEFPEQQSRRAINKLQNKVLGKLYAQEDEIEDLKRFHDNPDEYDEYDEYNEKVNMHEIPAYEVNLSVSLTHNGYDHPGKEKPGRFYMPIFVGCLLLAEVFWLPSWLLLFPSQVPRPITPTRPVPPWP